MEVVADFCTDWDTSDFLDKLKEFTFTCSLDSSSKTNAISYIWPYEMPQFNK